MTWFFLALIGPFLYALTNYIDKILLEKYFKQGGVGTILLFSSLLSIFAIPFLFLMDPTAISIGLKNIFILAIVGILNVGVLWCYLLALKHDEASVVIVFYQLVPFFGAILGYFFLGEILNTIQIIAMAIIILGTTIVSFEIDSDNHFKLRKKTILPMLGASLFWAIGGVIFKAVALEESIWGSLFWEHCMLVIVGIIIFTFIRSYRVNFLSAIKSNSKTLISFMGVNELIYIGGNVTVAYAYMLAPIGLVLLTESFQPIFVLAIGLFLTLFFPKVMVERIQAKHLWPKIIAICITGIGTYLLLAF